MAENKKTKPKKRPDPADREGTTRGAEKSPPTKRAPKTSPRPPSRAEGKASQSQRFKEDREKRESGMAAGGKVKGYADGGTVRGMGAAKRGGKFTRSC